MTEPVSRSPLSWPAWWPRTPAGERRRSPFGQGASKPSVHEATCDVLDELRRSGIDTRDAILSTNLLLRLDGLPRSGQPAPEDPGVAVYFELDGAPHVLACDRWTLVGCNLRAIAKHVEALRGQERWGVGSVRQAFAGFKALPESSVVSARSWRDVLGLAGVAGGVTRGQVQAAYRGLAKVLHPDRQSGSESAMVELNQAYAQALLELSA